MDPVHVEQPITPQPSIPRAIGSLNFVFGSLLFLLGWGGLNYVGPSFCQNRPFAFEAGDLQHLYDQGHRELVTALEAREATTKDAAKKDRLKQQRLELAAKHRNDVERAIDRLTMNRDLLWASWYLWADLVTGPVLNLLMLASGMGLIQMKEWARKMALWIAGVKLARLVLLSGVLMAVVIPRTEAVMERVAATPLGEVLVARLNSDNAELGTKNPAAVIYTTRNLPAEVTLIQYVLAIMVLIVGSIFPTLTLILLTRPGAQAACLLAEEEESE